MRQTVNNRIDPVVDGKKVYRRKAQGQGQLAMIARSGVSKLGAVA